MNKYYIKESDWEKIYTFLRKSPSIRVGNERKTRAFAEGVYFIMRTGAKWRELPKYHSKWISLTPRQRHDITQASMLLQGFEHANIIADKAYDSNALIGQIQQQYYVPVIPCRFNRKLPRNYDEHLYKERHLVECFFNKIKHFRRIFSRFDKKASSFAGFLAYASFILCLR